MSSAAITVYTTPGCVQCAMTKRYLDGAGAVYRTVDLTESLDDYRAVKYLGYTQAPVVVALWPSGGETHWSGFRPDLLAVAVAGVA